MRRRVAGGAAWWAVLWALYMLLVGKNELAEWIAGAVAAGLGIAAIGVVSSRRKRRFAPRWRWLSIARRLPAEVLSDCWTVTAELWRLLRGQAARGRFRLVPFNVGGQDPVNAARRALVTIGASVGPNTDVLAIDAERQVVLMHQLVPSPDPPGKGDREWPV